MKVSSLRSNLLVAFASQGVALLTSVAMTLFVPRILGVEEFGYWQLFVFYSNYVSFFQLGLNDGVYLKQGGKSRHEIDKVLVSSQFMLGMSFQLVIALAIVAYAFLFGENEQRAFVLVFTGAYLLISNATYFFGFVFQAMNETKKFSYGVMLDRVSFLGPMIICAVAGAKDFRVYVVLYTISRMIACAYTFWHARDFIGANQLPFRKGIQELLAAMRLGFILTLANISFQTIMGAARFFIDSHWGIQTFGKVSFALSMVNIVIIFAQQVSVVLFPALRQSDSQDLPEYYRTIRQTISLLLPACFLAFYPVSLLIHFWLPEYEDSARYLIYVMPVCLFTIQKDMLYATFLKLRNEVGVLLLMNLFGLVVACTGILVSVYVVGSVNFVVLSAVIGMMLTIFAGDLYLSPRYGVQGRKLLFANAALSLGFIAVNANASMSWAATTVCGFLLVFYLVFFKQVRAMISTMRGATPRVEVAAKH